MLEGLCTSSNRMIRNKNAAVFLNRGKTYSANLPVVLRLKSEAHKLKVWPTAKSRHQHHQCYTKTLKINCFFYVCFFLFEMALSLLHSNTVSLTQTGVKVGLQGFLPKNLQSKCKIYLSATSLFFCAQFSRYGVNSCLEVNKLRFYVIFLSEKFLGLHIQTVLLQ